MQNHCRAPGGTVIQSDTSKHQDSNHALNAHCLLCVCFFDPLCCLVLQQSSSGCYMWESLQLEPSCGERLSSLVGNEGCSMNCALQICQSSKWVGTTWLVSVLILFFLTVFPIGCTLLSCRFGCCLLTCTEAQAGTCAKQCSHRELQFEVSNIVSSRQCQKSGLQWLFAIQQIWQGMTVWSTCI